MSFVPFDHFCGIFFTFLWMSFRHMTTQLLEILKSPGTAFNITLKWMCNFIITGIRITFVCFSSVAIIARPSIQLGDHNILQSLSLPFRFNLFTKHFMERFLNFRHYTPVHLGDLKELTIFVLFGSFAT